MLQEGLLKVFNLQSMEQEYSIRTFQVHSLRQTGILNQRYDSDLLAVTAFIPDFDIGHKLYAYVYNEINEEDVL